MMRVLYRWIKIGRAFSKWGRQNWGRCSYQIISQSLRDPQLRRCFLHPPPVKHSGGFLSSERKSQRILGDPSSFTGRLALSFHLRCWRRNLSRHFCHKGSLSYHSFELSCLLLLRNLFQMLIFLGSFISSLQVEALEKILSTLHCFLATLAEEDSTVCAYSFYEIMWSSLKAAAKEVGGSSASLT